MWFKKINNNSTELYFECSKRRSSGAFKGGAQGDHVFAHGAYTRYIEQLIRTKALDEDINGFKIKNLEEVKAVISSVLYPDVIFLLCLNYMFCKKASYCKDYKGIKRYCDLYNSLKSSYQAVDSLNRENINKQLEVINIYMKNQHKVYSAPALGTAKKDEGVSRSESLMEARAIKSNLKDLSNFFSRKNIKTVDQLIWDMNSTTALSSVDDDTLDLISILSGGNYDERNGIDAKRKGNRDIIDVMAVVKLIYNSSFEDSHFIFSQFILQLWHLFEAMGITDSTRKKFFRNLSIDFGKYRAFEDFICSLLGVRNMRYRTGIQNAIKLLSFSASASFTEKLKTSPDLDCLAKEIEKYSFQNDVVDKEEWKVERTIS